MKGEVAWRDPITYSCLPSGNCKRTGAMRRMYPLHPFCADNLQEPAAACTKLKRSMRSMPNTYQELPCIHAGSAAVSCHFITHHGTRNWVSTGPRSRPTYKCHGCNISPKHHSVISISHRSILSRAHQANGPGYVLGTKQKSLPAASQAGKGRLSGIAAKSRHNTAPYNKLC